MNKKTNVQLAIAGLITAAGITQSALAFEVARGANVETLAANCNIGSFPQTGKAGEYNGLCHVMQDAEKCLALVKRGFSETGPGEVKVEPLHDKRAAYCFEVLTRELLQGNDE